LSAYFGTPGTCDTASPTSTSTIGAGTGVRSASPATTTATTSRANIAAMSDSSRCTTDLLRTASPDGAGGRPPVKSLPGDTADRERFRAIAVRPGG
jgi:hypothetical protein